MIPERRLGALVISSLIVAALLGCGSHEAGLRQGSSQRSSESSNERAEPRLPAADRRAYLEIASDSGTLRVSVVRAALGRSATVDTGAILAARRRLALARPTDAGLVRLKAQLLAACSDAIAHTRSRAGVRHAGRDALAATDKVNAGLRGYAARHPAVAGLIPD